MPPVLSMGGRRSVWLSVHWEPVSEWELSARTSCQQKEENYTHLHRFLHSDIRCLASALPNALWDQQWGNKRKGSAQCLVVWIPAKLHKIRVHAISTCKHHQLQYAQNSCKRHKIFLVPGQASTAGKECTLSCDLDHSILRAASARKLSALRAKCAYIVGCTLSLVLPWQKQRANPGTAVWQPKRDITSYTKTFKTPENSQSGLDQTPNLKNCHNLY